MIGHLARRRVVPLSDFFLSCRQALFEMLDDFEKSLAGFLEHRVGVLARGGRRPERRGFIRFSFDGSASCDRSSSAIRRCRSAMTLAPFLPNLSCWADCLASSVCLSKSQIIYWAWQRNVAVPVQKLRIKVTPITSRSTPPIRSGDIGRCGKRSRP